MPTRVASYFAISNRRISWLGRATENASIIYAFDFGLAKMYVDSVKGEHIPLRTGRGFCGTWRYSSHWSHLGVGGGLCYIASVFLAGRLTRAC
ncbi:uncharacterized protein BT62DRAFT_545032 [Guyanagaster necrorhizus]|uniref:Uncharacterized protein n=1 Tax=Guyanagaster necrorhizus TaxID=856835 RepID=A0A9P7W427_9AGAR|nr:uncharacterized protein BT62DRAFT_545032 [Guyanagaster necrorhizus MCA 3950]KAG7450926.1 hypothetical protein BT62DRAFT_545032 [Guyanagaster necrorhizus MCA 3950]